MVGSIAGEPGSAAIAAANAASNAGDWPLAVNLWEALRAEHPGDKLCWSKAGEAYWRGGLFGQADALLAAATARFDDDLWLAHQYAFVAQQVADWPEALRRANDLFMRFPGYAIGYILRGEGFQALGRLDDAEAAFAEGAGLFPRDEWTLFRHAELAEHRQDWQAALARWEAMLAVFPEHKGALVGRDRALRCLGRPGEAEAAVEGIRGAVMRELAQLGVAARLPERLANPVVFIEITSICNFACTYCVSPMKLRDKRQMSLDTYRRVIAEIAELTTNPLRLHIDGEPTSHPQFKEMALLANAHGLPIALATNGSLLDPSFLDIWMDPLISMSTLPEELAKRHNKLNFERYVERIADYAAAWARSQSRQNLFFQIIHYPQADAAAELEYRQRKNAFLSEFARRAGLYESCTEESSVEDEDYRFQRRGHPGGLHFLKQRVSIGGLYPEEGRMLERPRATAGFCDAPWRQLVIHSNGTLGACCVDLSGGTTFASADEAATVPLKELWERSPQIRAMRDAFTQGRVERDICQRCLSQGQVMFPPTAQ